MLGAIKVAAGRIRALLLWLFATLRRACCCFRRRRRNSESQPLTAIGIVPNLPPEVRMMILSIPFFPLNLQK